MSSLSNVVLPTAEAELWRYSRIGELELSSFAVGALSTTVSGDKSVVSRKSHLALAEVSSEAADVFETLHHEQSRNGANTVR
ncbi:MAG: hypothetical protein ACKOXX_03955, partial [Actinomycetota bacterium]